MNPKHIVDSLLDTDLDDPASNMPQLVNGVRSGEVRCGDLVIRQVRSRDGADVGVPTGGARRCSAGCSSPRIGVSWSDKKVTWVCLRSVSISGDTAQII